MTDKIEQTILLLKRIHAALELIERYGQIDGGHHKAWVLDQVARVLTAEKYNDWKIDMLGEPNEEHGGHEYSYDEGIAP